MSAPEPQTFEHEEHVLLETWSEDCVEGECDHGTDGDPTEDLSQCPSTFLEICVDCMDDRGAGRDPGLWENVTRWPCDLTPETTPEPPMFKPEES